jgi:hypothetical protein
MLYREALHPHFDAHHSLIAHLSLWKSSPYAALRTSLVQGPRWITQSFWPTPSRSNREDHDGYLPIFQTEEQKNASILSARSKLAKGLEVLNQPGPLRHKYWEWAYAHHLGFLKKISNICKTHHIKLVLLLLPKCGFQSPETALKNHYLDLGEFWVPPPELLQHENLWRDLGHLNKEGASSLANWLAHQL